MTHPAQYSPEVLAVIRPMIRPGDHIHDPFAGTGVRLAAVCDAIGATYSGGDIEDWPDKDSRVSVADALDPTSYPTSPHIVVTSPVYQNKRLGDYVNGPTPTTKTKGRRDYGIALGRALSPNNLARWTGRPSRADGYWERHAAAAKLWPRRVIVNVDEPIGIRWCTTLEDVGYSIADVRPAVTRRDRSQQHTSGYAPCEVVIVAVRT